MKFVRWPELDRFLTCRSVEIIRTDKIFLFLSVALWLIVTPLFVFC